jgi:hypothetical protein
MKRRPVPWLSVIEPREAPPVISKVTFSTRLKTSGSARAMRLPFAVEKTTSTSSGVVCGPGAVTVGASFDPTTVSSESVLFPGVGSFVVELMLTLAVSRTSSWLGARVWKVMLTGALTLNGKKVEHR